MTTVCLWLMNPHRLCPYIGVGSRDGDLVEPIVIVDHAVAGPGGGQLTAQHPPGQAEVHHALHG